MNAVAATPARPETRVVLPPPSWKGDAVFRFLTWLMAMMVFVLVIIVGWELYQGAGPSLKKFGWTFFWRTDWAPEDGPFGALPFIFGTFVSSILGLIVAVPLSMAAALYLTELAPRWLRQPAASLIEMLAGIPSVILGLWGLRVMIPWLRDHLYPGLQHVAGFLPLFKGPIYGPCILSAVIILAIMIVPIITSMSREVFQSVPDSHREAAYALGATRWEVIRLAVLRGSSRGVFGASMLGLGRALGETMAVTMVIGNSPKITASLFAPASTLASAIANEFSEATGALYLSALFELGLVLLLVTLMTNVFAHLILGAMGGTKTGRHA